MSDYPSDWDSRRREVYERDNHACQNCGRSSRERSDLELHAHHIVPISKGGSHAKTNLSTMCSECHNAIHNDNQAPTASGTPSSSDRMTNYQDLFKQAGAMAEYLNELGGHLTVSKDSVGLDQILVYYENQADSARKDIHGFKRDISSFDPYDNADSENVQEDFKSVVETMKDKMLLFIDEVLELDRLLTRFVEELTTVNCSDCGTTHSETTDFCGECGAELPVLSMCPECEKTREDTQQNYCQGCGTGLNSYPDSRLQQIETTQKQHEKAKDSMLDTAEQATDFQTQEVLPLWKRELS